MASTLKKAPLKVSIIEIYSLNGRDHVVENSILYSDIREVDSRILTIPAVVALITPNPTTVAVLTSGAAAPLLDVAGPGQYIATDVRYIRITNLDSEKSIQVVGAAHNDVAIEVTAGSSYVLTDVFTGTAETSITVQASAILPDGTANTDSVDVEIFVASV